MIKTGKHNIIQVTDWWVALALICTQTIQNKYVTLHEKTKHNVLDINLRYRPE